MMLLTLKSYFNAYKILYHQLKFSGLSYLLYCNNLRQVMFKPLHRTVQGFYTQPGSVQYLYEVGHSYTEQGFQSRTPSYTEQTAFRVNTCLYYTGQGIQSRPPSYMEQGIQSRTPGYMEQAFGVGHPAIWSRAFRVGHLAIQSMAFGVGHPAMEQGIRSKTTAYTEQDTQLYGLGYMIVMTGT